MKTSHIISISILVVIGILTAVLINKPATPSIPTETSEILKVNAADNVWGEENAAITLIEYSDFQCPACAAYYPIIQQLKNDLGDDLRVVYRHFPLRQIHFNAQISAQASQAAALQGQFWPMHNKIFETQTLWSNMTTAKARETFISYAEELGLETKKFTTDMDSDLVKQKIQVDVDASMVLKLPGTPTFFANGAQLPSPRSYEELLQSLQALIPSDN